MFKYEIYTSIEGRKKTYLVTDSSDIYTLVHTAMKHFHVAIQNVQCVSAWILNDELYLENPHNKKATECWAAYCHKGK